MIYELATGTTPKTIEARSQMPSRYPTLSNWFLHCTHHEPILRLKADALLELIEKEYRNEKLKKIIIPKASDRSNS